MCNTVIAYGDVIEKLPHTQVRVGYVEATWDTEGYTGDVVCSVCNSVLAYGEKIAKLGEDMRKITIHFEDEEYVVTFPYGVDPWEYTSQRANKSAEHTNLELEMRVFELLNEERVKAGVEPLEWDENGYYFTKTRAEECVELFSHERPDGSQYFSIYFRENVYAEHLSENIFRGINVPEHLDWAAMAAEGWMNSPLHRANVLNPNYTKCAIAFVKIGDTFTFVHHFYG